MVRLRGHHLICLHFFRGEGYSEHFIENLDRVLEAASAEGVEVVVGGDDVCKACPSYQGGKCTHEPGMEKRIRRLDALATKLLKLEKGHTDWIEIRSLIPTVIRGWKKHACKECEWLKTCEKTELWQR